MGRFVKAAAVLAMCALLLCGAAYADSSWKLAGTWNYTASVPYQSVTLSGVEYEYKCDESGTMVMHMYEDAGTEYYKSYDCSYSGTSYVKYNGEETPKAYSGSYSKDFVYSKYTPGDTVKFEQTITIRDMSVNETMYLKQVAENRIEGTVTLELDGQTVSGTVTATRNSGGDSGGGGGCNAGFGALALLMALPMFYRKKK